MPRVDVRWRGGHSIALGSILAIAGCAEPPPSEMVDVESGPFQQGCDSGVEIACMPWELPLRTVTLSSFSIDRTEVTRSAYALCVDAGVCLPPACEWEDPASSQLPVVCIPRDQAETYCEWRGQRLPTEAEWEKAARGGDARIYAWGNDSPDCARSNIAGCTGGADPVGRHSQGMSPYGLLDVSGNVCEWTAEWWDETYYASAPLEDPPGPSEGTLAVVRDGFYEQLGDMVRTARRHGIEPATAHRGIGFRCAL